MPSPRSERQKVRHEAPAILRHQRHRNGLNADSCVAMLRALEGIVQNLIDLRIASYQSPSCRSQYVAPRKYPDPSSIRVNDARRRVDEKYARVKAIERVCECRGFDRL